MDSVEFCEKILNNAKQNLSSLEPAERVRNLLLIAKELIVKFNLISGIGDKAFGKVLNFVWNNYGIQIRGNEQQPTQEELVALALLSGRSREINCSENSFKDSMETYNKVLKDVITNNPWKNS